MGKCVYFGHYTYPSIDIRKNKKVQTAILHLLKIGPRIEATT